MTRDVVVTGVGAVTPLGDGAEALLDRWLAGDSGIRQGVGRCESFDPSRMMSRKELRRADRFTQLLLCAAAHAFDQAGWEDDELPCAPERIGCVTGSGIGGAATIEAEQAALLNDGPSAVSPIGLPMMMPNAGTAQLAQRFDLRGPSFTTVSACASGGHAIGEAMRIVRAGDADAMVAGGAEAAVTPLVRGWFEAMGALSPTGSSLPFDRRRDGFVLAEGAAVVVLEEAGLARRRGARVLATLRGYGASADAHHLTAPEPRGRGAAAAIRRAIADAGCESAQIAYVNAHGTGTPANDVSETLAIKQALGEHARKVPVSSTKSAIGHTLGAAGAIELVATVESLARRVVPPTLGYRERDPELDLDYVPGSGRPLESENGDPPLALSNSFGFGGHNAVLCVEGPA